MKQITLFSLQVLVWISEGKGTHHKCHGQSEHGGRAVCIVALIRRGLIDRDYHVTDLGREIIAKEQTP